MSRKKGEPYICTFSLNVPQHGFSEDLFVDWVLKGINDRHSEIQEKDPGFGLGRITEPVEIFVSRKDVSLEDTLRGVSATLTSEEFDANSEDLKARLGGIYREWTRTFGTLDALNVSGHFVMWPSQPGM